MENNKSPFTNGLSNSTIDLIDKFQTRINTIKATIPLETIIAYIERNETIPGIPDEIYEQLYELKKYEIEAIQNELPSIKRQANKHRIPLPRTIERVAKINIDNLDENPESKKQFDKINFPVVPSFSQKTLEKIPNLRVFEGFVWIPDKYLEMAKQTESSIDDNELQF